MDGHFVNWGMVIRGIIGIAFVIGAIWTAGPRRKRRNSEDNSGK